MALYHAYSQTIADGTATSVVRPSDWNSAHSQVMTLAGNTAGASTVSGTNVIFQGGNNVTLSANQAAGVATIVFSGPTQSVQTQASGNIVGSGFTSTTTAGVNVVGTLNSQGLSMAVPQYITTFQNDLTSGRAGTGFTSTTTAGTAVVGTLNTNGLSMGVPAYITTFQNDLTSGRAGTGFTSTTTAGTAVVGTLNTNGLSLGVPAYITTFQNDLTSGRAGTGFTSTTTAGTAIVATQNTAGLSMGVPAFITTFTQPGATVFSNSNNVSFGLNGSTVTATATFAQSAQTANFYVSGNTTQLSSTAGLDLRSLSFEGAGIASVGVSNGRVLVSVPSGGGAGDGYNIVAMGTDPVGGGATSGATFSTISGSIYLQAGNNMTLSQTSNSINISAADVKWSLVGNTAGTNSSNLSANQFYFSGGDNITLSGNSNTIVISAAAGGAGAAESNYMPFKDALWAPHQVGQNSIQVQPLANVPVVSYDRLAYGVQFTQATNSTMTVSCTVHMGVYSKNGSTLSQITSHSGSFSINGSGTASSSANSGPRWATMALNAGGTFSGDVWVAFRSSTATAGVNATLSNLMASRVNSTWSGFIGVGTANSVQSLPGMGFYSATSSALPTSMAFSHITGVSSTAQRPQIFFLSNGAFPV